MVQSIAESLPLDSNNESAYARLKEIFTNKSLQMATFTITEKGYSLVNGKGEQLPDITGDFVDGPEKPASYMGKVTSLLYARFKAGELPIAMVSTDNCSHNGDKLYAAILAFAKAWAENGKAEKEFVEYIDSNKVSFTWSMIDKITPRPDASVEKNLLNDGVEELDPVITSKNTYVAPFVNAEETEYLVIEDNFPNGRLDLTKGGLMFTDRDTVDKVEKMKVCTCLNPLHTCLAIFGCVLGYNKISDEMKDEELVKLVETVGYKEGLPVVVNPGILDPKEFIDTYYEDDTRVPLTYQITADGLLTITNFWTKETIVTASVDLQGGEISYIDITNAGPMYGVTINTINPNNIVTLLISNGTVISESRGHTVLQENVVNLDEDTIVVYENGTNPNTLYFNANGEPLIEQDTNAIYADRYAVCTMQNGKLCITPRGQFAYNLPIAEDEYLVLTTGEGRDNWLGGDMVLALDSSGEEILRLPGYGITGNSAYISNGMIVNENTPLVLYTEYEGKASDDSDYASAQMGIYSLKDRKWIVEPARQSVTLFTDSVYMIGSDVGNLYRIDGTCIEEGAEDVTVQGNFIISRRVVYDKTGQRLTMIQENESVLTVLYDEILINQYFPDGSHYTKCVNAQGELIWIEQSGLTWTGGEVGWRIYKSWNDTNGKGLLTAMGDDNTLKIVLSEDELSPVVSFIPFTTRVTLEASTVLFASSNTKPIVYVPASRLANADLSIVRTPSLYESLLASTFVVLPLESIRPMPIEAA